MLTVISVIFLYLPLSLYSFIGFLLVPKHPFRLSIAHGPMWKFIRLIPLPKAPWYLWIGIILAFTSFFLLGFTRPAKTFYEGCVEWFFDHSPKTLQGKSKGMAKISQKCKDRRNVRAAANASFHEMYPPRNVCL
jgi:hypothetical protein